MRKKKLNQSLLQSSMNFPKFINGEFFVKHKEFLQLWYTVSKVIYGLKILHISGQKLCMKLDIVQNMNFISFSCLTFVLKMS